LIGRIERGEAIEQEVPPAPRAKVRDVVPPSLLTVEELVERFMEHAAVYYRHPDSSPTGEQNMLRHALGPLLDVHLAVLVSDFRPRDLRAVQQEMIARGWCRRHINACVRRIKTLFAWGTEMELVAPEVAGSLRMVRALKEGRSLAREKPEIEAVPDSTIEAVLPHMSPVAAAVVQIMRYSGCRPGEVKFITVETLDRSDPECWKCSLAQHKTSYAGKRRTLHFGPRCQEVLTRWLVRAGSGPLFPISHPGLRTAIARACDRAGVPRFGPNALRHRAGTEARKEFGLEGAQHLLGHAHAKTTEIYAELDFQKARQVAMAIG
jgi:integrase